MEADDGQNPFRRRRVFGTEWLPAGAPPGVRGEHRFGWGAGISFDPDKWPIRRCYLRYADARHERRTVSFASATEGARYSEDAAHWLHGSKRRDGCG